MHVLFVSTRSPYPLNGGHPLRTFHLLREAAKRHYVSFLTFIQHEEEWEGLSVIREFCEDVRAFRVPADASPLLLGAGLAANTLSTQPFVARKYDTRAMRQAIRSVREEVPVDLLHLDMLPLAVYDGEANGAPVVLVDHNVEYVLLERRAQTETGVGRRFWTVQAQRLKRFEAAAVRSATRSIAVSDVDAAILRGLVPGAEVRTVPNGVDVSYFEPSEEPPDPNEIVFVGAMTHHPNVDSVRYFIDEMWPRIRAARPGAHFTVIGAHPPESIRALDGTDGVTVAGQVPDIRPYVCKAAVYVVPLRIGGGTRLKILDAMAMGKAIVSTSIGCEGLAVSDGVDIAVEDVPDRFADRVLSLMGSPGACEAMGRTARATVERCYTWESLGEIQDAVYQEARAAAARPAEGAAR